MGRRFQIEELRTLAARALQTSDYAPAESARVRAIPDTRTIRYYTTLGLLAPPAEMRGRVAFYDELHVLQILAIKRLQAQNLTLSEIQQRLVGLTPARLKSFAKLPSGFWDEADQYLANLTTRRAELDDPGSAVAEPSTTSSTNSQQDTEHAFWLVPAALPSSIDTPQGDESVPESAKIVHAIHVNLAPDIKVIIELSGQPPGGPGIDLHSLIHAAQPLVHELRKQKLINAKPLAVRDPSRTRET